ncbi:hypothetical protein B0H10DRAFT_1946009 [Mycena sp. CBHHK59/15]|nr:hypothetical protein B0H10DRAFT_1946009 [Mycena sp. CBHHK59/15]
MYMRPLGSVQDPTRKNLPEPLEVREFSDYPSSSLTFAAHLDVPILVLENMKFLIDAVECCTSFRSDNALVNITFITKDAYAATLGAWASVEKFMLVTAHPTCNPSDQRGAWLVSSVQGENHRHGIVLHVHPVPLHELGTSFKMSHVAGPGLRPSTLHARDVDKVFPVDKTFDFELRQQLLPIDTSLASNSLTASIASVAEAQDPSGLQIFCVDCVPIANFSVGLEISVTNLTNLNYAYVNLTLQHFQHDVQLEMSLSGTSTYDKTLGVVLIALPDLGINESDIGAIGFFYGAAVRMDLEVSGELNFTVGASTDPNLGTKLRSIYVRSMIVVDDNAAAAAGQTASLGGQLPAATGTLLPVSAAIPSFHVAAIESYYSAHGALPTNVNYTQMLMATTVPDDIMVVQKAGTAGLHGALSLMSVGAAVTFRAAMVLGM